MEQSQEYLLIGSDSPYKASKQHKSRSSNDGIASMALLIISLVLAILAVILGSMAYQRVADLENSRMEPCSTSAPTQAASSSGMSAQVSSGASLQSVASTTLTDSEALLHYSRAQLLTAHPFCQRNWKACGDLLASVESILSKFKESEQDQSSLEQHVRTGALSYGSAFAFTADIHNSTIRAADPYLADFEGQTDDVAGFECDYILGNTCFQEIQFEGGNKSAMIVRFGDFSVSHSRRDFSYDGTWSGLGEAAGEGALKGAVKGAVKGFIIGAFADGAGAIPGAAAGALKGAATGGLMGAAKYAWHHVHF